MTGTPRTCPTCAVQLPQDAHPLKTYCCRACWKRADRRRKAGQPIQDRPGTDPGILAELEQLRKDNARLRKLLGRVHATRRKHQARADSAAGRIAAAARQAEAAKLEAASTFRKAREDVAAAKAATITARQEAQKYRNQVEDQRQTEAERDQATIYARNLSAAVRNEQRKLGRILRDYNYLAGRYFRNRSPEIYDEHDRSILATWQAFRKRQAGTETASGSGNHQRKGPQR